MKTKFLLLVTLAGALVSAPAWAQDERELLIEPRLPDSNDLITISVTNSRCYSNAEVFPPTPEDHSMWVRLTYEYHTDPDRQCRSNPDAPDFETTIGPIPTGDYSVALFVHTGGFGSNVTDEKFFTVIDAPPPAINLSEGGITGLYFNPAADGSYISVLETNYNTLVIWNTFDADGNQLWVYGVGDLLHGDSTVVADTYINRSVGFLPNGEVDAEAEPWGVLRLDLASCTEGTFTYRSDLRGFDSGQFPIVRLAYSKQIGCNEN